MVRSLIVILLLTGLHSWSGAQPINPLDLAESLYENGSYNDAITEYKRYLFFTGDENNPNIYHRLGLCYRFIGDWTNAEAMTKMAIDLQEDDSIRSDYYLDLVVTYMASGNYPAAELRLLKLISFSDQASVKRRASFFQMVNYIFQKKWKECRATLSAGLALDDSIAAETLMRRLEKHIKGEKSPSTAKWLSTFVPGSGQLYGGHLWPALNAAAINGFLGYSLVDQIRKGAPLSDVSYWIFMFERFWSGNRNKAAEMVKQDIIERDARFRRELLDSVGKIIK